MLLTTTLWPALLGAFTLGMLVGVLTGLPSSPSARAVALFVVAVAVGFGVLAVGGLLAERPSFWIEAGALILGTYIFGCLAGGSVAWLGARRAAGA